MSARTHVGAEQTQTDTGITPGALGATLKEKLEASHVDIADLSGMSILRRRRLPTLMQCSGGCGQMFEAIIVSPQFAKKTTLARHRLVNNTLKEEVAAIHAWTPKCYTPEEWEKRNGAV